MLFRSSLPAEWNLGLSIGATSRGMALGRRQLAASPE